MHEAKHDPIRIMNLRRLGMSYESIGHVLHIGAAAANVNVHRARRRLAFDCHQGRVIQCRCRFYFDGIEAWLAHDCPGPVEHPKPFSQRRRSGKFIDGRFVPWPEWLDLETD